MRRHEYLDAYRLHVSGPLGEWAATLAEVSPGAHPARRNRGAARQAAADAAQTPATSWRYSGRRRRLRGWVKVSRHFDDMTVHPPDAEGWVRVTAKTDDSFTATRLLLSYGPYCRVLGDAEALKEMSRLVNQMQLLYATNGAT